MAGPGEGGRGKTRSCVVANQVMGSYVGHKRGKVERYVDWRSRCLREAGFERPAAERLAHDTAWDLHVLLELVDRGCPPELAERILAPQHWEVRSQ